MLHIVKTVSALEDVVNVFREGDSLLLIEQAVYAANSQHKAYRQIKGLETFVLSADSMARGIENRITPNANLVDYDGFVELTIKHSNSITWE